MDINWLDANYLPWLIPVPPLVSFLLITLGIGRYRIASAVTATASVFLSFLMAWPLFFHAAFGTSDFGVVGDSYRIFGSNLTWMDVGTADIEFGVHVDPLSAVMLFMVSIAMLMIFIYSIGYMQAYPQDDPHQLRFSRFFAYLSLFAGAMLTLVVADNLLLLFMGWEIMGLCSYLLIGFLFEKKSAYQAAVKAFMTTRIADVFLLVGIGYLYVETGSLSYREILLNEELLGILGDAEQTGFIGLSAAAIIGTLIVIGTIGKAAQFPLHGWLPDAMEGPTPVSAMIHAAAMVSAGVYLVIRFFPLMEAGGNPHHAEYTLPLIVMGVVGSVTALGGGILGIAQNDIKRVLAYSTISQLGFMVAALGIGAYIAAAFHLITHAFFKALLFMSSGAVIHAMEHGEHHLHELGRDDEIPHRHPDDPYPVYGADWLGREGEAPDEEDWQSVRPRGIQLNYVAVPNDMTLMGGLINKIPITAFAMLAGVASLAGAPLITAGFWSKDEILLDSLLFITAPSEFSDFGNAPWLHVLVFFSLFAAAISTAFYSFRLWFMTFLHEPRSAIAEYATLKHEHHHHDHDHDHTHDDDHAHDDHALIEHKDDAVAEHDEEEEEQLLPFTRDEALSWWATYGNSALMQAPLVVLAFFAITVGFAGIHPDFFILEFFTGGNNFFFNFVSKTLPVPPPKAAWTIWPVLASFTAFFVGFGFAYALYGVPMRKGDRDPVRQFFPDSAWTMMQNRLHLDNIFLTIFYIPSEWVARKVAYQAIDKETIDEFLHGVGDTFVFLGESAKRINYVVIDGVGDGIPRLISIGSQYFRSIQSGNVQQYLLFGSGIMLLVILSFFFVL